MWTEHSALSKQYVTDTCNAWCFVNLDIHTSGCGFCHIPRDVAKTAATCMYDLTAKTKTKARLSLARDIALAITSDPHPTLPRVIFTH